MVPPILDCFCDFTARFICAKARRLIGRAGFRQSDLEDLIQELVLDLWKRREHFDPQKGSWEAFVVVVCENGTASILAHRQAALRSPKHEYGSLNCSVSDANGRCTEADVDVVESQHCIRTCQRFVTHEEASEVELDVSRALDQLDPQSQELCKRLMVSSISDVARETGVSRQNIYRQIATIRQHFESAGLRVYIQFSSGHIRWRSGRS